MSSVAQLETVFQLPIQAEEEVSSIKIEHILIMKMLASLNEKSESVLQDVERMQKQRSKNKGE